jgi:TP901 family phage tail tape measure protein
MSSLGEMYAELAIKTDKLQSGSSKSEAVLRKLNADIDNITESINGKLETIGKNLSLTVTAPLAILGYQSVKTFASFEQAMQNTFSVMSASASEMELLRATAEKMGAETRFSASQAANALYSLGSAGQNAQTSIKSLDGVLKLAGATGSDLESTSAMLASTLSQFKLSADQSSRVADVFARAISKSQANMGKLAYSMRYVGPLAAGFNMSLEGTTAALMALYNAGYQGEQAGTIMRGGLTVLAKQTSKLDESLKALGLTYEEVNPATNSFADIIEKLKKSGADTTRVLEIFGSEAGAGMAALVEMGGEAIRAFDGVLQSSKGAAAEMQAIQNASTANAIDEMRSAWEAVQITLTGNVKPAIDAVIGTITQMLRTVEALPAGFQVAGSAAMIFAAAAGPILLVAMNVKKLKAEMVKLNVTMASNPFLMWGTIAAGAVAVIAGVVAQVKKAQEEHEKLSRQVLESAKQSIAKSNEEMDKAQTIDTLLAKYNSLKNTVNTSTEAQAEYNDVIKQLETLIPGVISMTDEYGNALEINTEKAREAAMKNLEIAAAEKKAALAKLETARLIANSRKIEYEDDLNRLRETERLQREEVRAEEEKFLHIQQLKAEYDNYIEKQNQGIQLSEEEARRWKEINDEIVRNNYTIGKAEGEYRKSTEELEETKKKIDEILKKYGVHIQVLEEVAALETEINGIKQHQSDLADGSINPLKTQQEFLNEYLEAKRKFDEEVQGKKQYAQRTGGQYDSVAAEIEFLDKQLKQLLEIKPGEIDKVFTLDDKGTIEGITQRLRVLYAEQERIKSAGSKKDKTWTEQLSELDDYWQKRISAAEAYGEDELALTAAYQQKRMELLEQFRQWAIGSGQYTEDSSLDIVLGGFQSIGKEIVKTARLSRGELEQFLAEWNNLTSELEKKQNEIATLSVYNPEVFAGSVEAWEAYKNQLQSRIKELEESLGQLKDDQIENPLKKAFEEKIDLGNLFGARAALIPYIRSLKEAQEANKNDNKVWQEKQDEIEDAEKKVDDLTNAIATQISTMGGAFTDIGQELASVISSAITDGTVDGFQVLKGISGIAAGIGKAIGDPIIMAIGEVAGAVFGIVETIYSAIKDSNQKEIDAYNQSIADSLAEWREEVAKTTEGTVDALAKVVSGGRLSVTSMFDSLFDSMKVNKINNFITELQDLETAIQDFSPEQVDTSVWYNPFSWGSKTTVNRDFNLTVSELMNAYYEAYSSGTDVLIGNVEYSAQELREAITETIEGALEESGFDSLVMISDYVSGIDAALTSYAQGGSLDDFEKAMKDSLKSAIMNSLLDTMYYQQIALSMNDMLSAASEGGNTITENEFNQFMANTEQYANNVREAYQEMAGALLDSTEVVAQINEELKKLSESIADTLTDSLGEAAMDMDWASFKSSFASQMKKAIIQAAVSNAGLADKVKSIVDGLLDDTDITESEINAALVQLQGEYNSLETKLAPLQKVIAGLTDATIETNTSGTIIQQLSGADRDYLGEQIKAAMAQVQQNLDFTGAAIQTIQATQLIINAVHVQYDGVININGTKDTDLRQILGELITQALGGQ